MSFCFLYNVVSENHSVQNSPWGGGGSIASSRSTSLTEISLILHQYFSDIAKNISDIHNFD